MQSLDVYKYINTLARQLRDDPSQGREETASFNKTFKDRKNSIHVFASHGACLQILKDVSFVQPRIADAVAEISGTLGVATKPIESFLRNNPIEMNGSVHAAARPAFVREYGATQRRMADRLPEIAQEVFEGFSHGKKLRIGSDLVEPYVDAVIEAIFNGDGAAAVSREHWAGTSSCIFEYVHSATKLKKKAVQVLRLSESAASTITSDDPREVRFAVLLLTYVLQGRDPLIGAMSAYMHSLIAMNEDERRRSLQGTTVNDLFWRNSPVNYIGRIATAAGSVGGIDIKAGDQIILMLPWANRDKNAPARSNLAFGAGAHICAGQALALAISNAWLGELKNRRANIHWEKIKPDRPVTAVFRQYRTQ